VLTKTGSGEWLDAEGNVVRRVSAPPRPTPPVHDGGRPPIATDDTMRRARMLAATGWRQRRFGLAVLEHGTVSAAARALNVNRTTIYRALDRMGE
jgi:DNA invertase Pin-like site-specific DNA recombinase